jgi:hypothetical protein
MIRSFDEVEKHFLQKKDAAPKKLSFFEGLNSELSGSIGS